MRQCPFPEGSTLRQVWLDNNIHALERETVQMLANAFVRFVRSAIYNKDTIDWERP